MESLPNKVLLSKTHLLIQHFNIMCNFFLAPYERVPKVPKKLVEL